MILIGIGEGTIEAAGDNGAIGRKGKIVDFDESFVTRELESVGGCRGIGLASGSDISESIAIAASRVAAGGKSAQLAIAVIVVSGGGGIVGDGFDEVKIAATTGGAVEIAGDDGWRSGGSKIGDENGLTVAVDSMSSGRAEVGLGAVSGDKGVSVAISAAGELTAALIDALERK